MEWIKAKFALDNEREVFADVTYVDDDYSALYIEIETGEFTLRTERPLKGAESGTYVLEDRILGTYPTIEAAKVAYLMLKDSEV